MGCLIAGRGRLTLGKEARTNERASAAVREVSLFFGRGGAEEEVQRPGGEEEGWRIKIEEPGSPGSTLSGRRATGGIRIPTIRPDRKERGIAVHAGNASTARYT